MNLVNVNCKCNIERASKHNMDDKEDAVVEAEAEAESEAEAQAVADFVRKEVRDWDDEVKCRARFKDFSGQRSDWEPLYLFWRDLILKVARHLRIFVIRPSHVECLWFRQNGLFPLCLHRVLVEMHRAGDLLPPISSTNQTTVTSRLSHIFRKSIDFFVARPSISNDQSVVLTEDHYILAPLLEEKALEVVQILSEDHWTLSCVVTMRKFQDICLGSKEALEILSYLSARGKAKRLVINTSERIEGVKICLAPRAIASASDAEYSLLHLIWMAEKLEQQLYLIDQRYQKTRNSALASLKSGNKRVALRYARELKQASLSREKCTALLYRVEKVIQIIADAESSKKVFEALQNSTHAIHENQICVEEVELCLQEIDENFYSMKQVENVLESTPSYAEMCDEDIEDEFNKLQLEINHERSQVSSKNAYDSSAVVPEVSSTTDLLGKALSNLNLKDRAPMGSVAEC